VTATLDSGSRIAKPQDRRWAIVAEAEPRLLSYLSKGLMFFQPSYRVASAQTVERLEEWQGVQDYEVAVMGCLGSAEAERVALRVVADIAAVVTVSCAHDFELGRDADLARPPMLSQLLRSVRAASGRTEISIDLNAMTEVIR
jgi:hypothetical protein